MDIESFVSQALEQLGAGVNKARSAPGVRISPSPLTNPQTNTAGDRLVTDQTTDIVSFVEFDLSVVVAAHVQGGAEVKAKANLLQVVDLDFGGAKLEGGIDHTRVQRIKFQVPVSFPAPATAADQT
jgi:hypothetical protein